MSLDLKFNKLERYLQVRVTGRFQLDDSIEATARVFSVFRSSGASRFPVGSQQIASVRTHAEMKADGFPFKFLIDVREVVGSLTDTEKIDYGYTVKEQYELYVEKGGVPLWGAFLGSPGTFNRSRPGTVIMITYNLPFASFTDISDALKWLEVE